MRGVVLCINIDSASLVIRSEIFEACELTNVLPLEIAVENRTYISCGSERRCYPLGLA